MDRAAKRMIGTTATKKIYDMKKLMYEDASQVANDVGSIRTVASFCAEEKVIELYKQKCEGPMRKGIKQGLISGIGFGVSFALLFLLYATCFYVGAQLVDDGRATFDEVFRVFFAFTMASLSISQSSSLTPNSSNAKSAAASIFAILDQKSEINPTNESGETIESMRGEIELRHVSFKYPSRPDIQIFVFQDLSLKIRSGKIVAWLGKVEVEINCYRITATVKDITDSSTSEYPVPYYRFFNIFLVEYLLDP